MLIKLMILILVAGFVGLFFIEGPDGKPLLSLDALLEDLSPATAVVEKSPAKPVKVYKWQDKNGIWQFGSQPVDGEDVEVMELDGNINIVAAFQIPEDKGSSMVGGQLQKPSSTPTLPPGLTSVSPEKIGEMMESLNNLQDTVDQRKMAIDKATGHGDRN